MLTNQPSAAETARRAARPGGLRRPGRSVLGRASTPRCARPLIAADVGRARVRAVVAGGTGLYLRAALAPLAAGARATRSCGPRWRRARRPKAPARFTPSWPGWIPRRPQPSTRGTPAAWSGRWRRSLRRGKELVGPRRPVGPGATTIRPLVVGLALERDELAARIDGTGRQDARGGSGGRGAPVPGGARAGGDGAGRPGDPQRDRLSRDLPRISTVSSTRQETAEQIAAATRRYARRQLTWLRKVRDAVIIDVQDREPGGDRPRDPGPGARASGPPRSLDADEAGQVARIGQRLPRRRGVGPSGPAHRPTAIVLLCDRHRGRRLRRHPAALPRPRAPFPARSPACGSSTPTAASRRCAATASASSRAISPRPAPWPSTEFTVETLAGPIRPRLLEDGTVRVDMGRARFQSANIDPELGWRATAADGVIDAVLESALEAATASPSSTWATRTASSVVDDPARSTCPTRGRGHREAPAVPQPGERGVHPGRGRRLGAHAGVGAGRGGDAGLRHRSHRGGSGRRPAGAGLQSRCWCICSAAT